MSGSDDDMGSIAWPGFVDILSSVIMMFVFFVMIVSSALYFHIIIFKSRILSEISQSTSAQSNVQELAKTNRSLMKKIEEMTKDMKVLEQIQEESEIQLYKQDAQFAESLEQRIQEDAEQNTLTVFFGKDSISVTKESKEIITRYIEQYADRIKNGSVTVRILSNKNKETLNEVVARKLAVARMLNTRNIFLAAEMPSEEIIGNVTSQDQIENSYDWLKIIFEEN